MANRYYRFAEREYYHVYNRGNSKQVLFKNAGDYDRFTRLLYLSNSSDRFVMRSFDDVDIYSIPRSEPLVHIGAYCLMPNHFHLLLTPAVEGGIPKFMLKVSTGYVSYFNKRNERTGGLFEGPYKARYADSDRYLKYLFSYIHLNAFRGKDEQVRRFLKVVELMEFPYSSLPDYLGVERAQGKLLDPVEFPGYFAHAGEHIAELREWLDYEQI